MKWPQTRRFKIIVISLVAVVTLVLLGILILYVRWQTSPEKAVLDAATYALHAPGTYHVTMQDSNFVVRVNEHKYGVEGKMSDTKFRAVVDRDMLYVNFDDPTMLYELATPSGASDGLQEAIKKALADTRNKWVMIDIDNLASLSDAGRKIECTLTSKRYAGDKERPDSQIFMTYLNNQFLTTQTMGSTSDTVTYRLDVDTAKLESFSRELTRTDFFRPLDDCQQTTVQGLTGDTYTLDVEMEKSNQRLVSMVVHAGEAQVAEVTADYTSAPTITTPSEYIGIQKIVGKVLQYLAPSFFSGS